MRRWVYEPAGSQYARGRAGRPPLVHASDVLQTFRYDDGNKPVLGSNQITARLLALDRSLTPNQGLRQIARGGKLVTVRSPVLTGKTLLLVHGTFSNNEMFLKQWEETPAGQALWAQLKQRYDNILTFDHPTLSVGPWLNALQLHAELRNVTGTIDVLSHSRGGLVVSWWLRLAPSPVRNVIFVGSPLEGTSLASPYRIRSALDHMATIVDLMAAGGVALSTIVPMAAGAAGLAKVFGGILRLGSSLPLADSAIAMIPGLASQQRVDNNLEHNTLFEEKWLPSKPVFMAIQASFQPEPSQLALWRVWDRLKSAGTQMAAGAADIIFGAENDLVVDTKAMAFLGKHHNFNKADILDLGPGSTHHTSYFRDDRVTAFLNDRLGA